jgi:nucleoside-specific outer membrane channel protein Tsx
MRLQPAAILFQAALLGTCASAKAEDFSLTDVQLLYSASAKGDPVNGTGTSNEKLATVRFEHFGTFGYGDNYFSLDLFRGSQVGGPGAGSGGAAARTQSFFVWMPRLSLSKLTSRSLQAGLLLDVGLTTRFEVASYGDFRATAPGVSLTWKVPGFAYLETALYARRSNFSSSHPLVRVVYIAPFEWAGRKFSADGLLLVSRPDNLGTNVLFQPELRISLDAAGKVDAGVRLEHARYALAGSKYSRTTPSMMLRWNW